MNKEVTEVYKDRDGKLVFNRLELTEDRARQSKANEMLVSRTLLQGLLNDSAKLNRIRILCEAEEPIFGIANEVIKMIKEKL